MKRTSEMIALLITAVLLTVMSSQTSFVAHGQISRPCQGAFLGTGGGPDIELPERYSFDVEAADSDADGIPDIIFVSGYAIASSGGFLPILDRLYARTGNAFVDVTGENLLPQPRRLEPSTDAEFGDLDGDDVLDLVVATDFGEPNRIYMGQRNALGEWTGVDQTQSRLRGSNDFSSLDVELFDADNDGDLDLIFAVAGGVNQLYLNDRTGVFTNVTLLNVIGAPADDTEDVEAADVDNDGDLDIVVANANTPDGEQDRIWINQGGLQGGTLGRFRDRTRTQLPRFIDVTVDVELADVDGDGDLDIYFSNSRPGGQQNRLLLNDGSGNFRRTEVTRTHLVQREDNTNDAEFCDIDSDGDLDLFLANGLFTLATGVQGETNRLFLNDGQGMFLQEVTATNYLGDSLASLDAEFVDMNGDGCCDLLIANYDGPDWGVFNTSAGGQTATLCTDDGSVENYFLSPGLIMVNRLTPPQPNMKLQAIRIRFEQGGSRRPNPTGQQIRLIAFIGPTGANQPPPNNPRFLVNKMVTVPGIGRFFTFLIANGPTIPPGNDVYVGYQAPSTSGAGGVVFVYDRNGPQQMRGYFSVDNGRTFQGPVTARILPFLKFVPVNLFICAELTS